MLIPIFINLSISISLKELKQFYKVITIANFLNLIIYPLIAYLIGFFWFVRGMFQIISIFVDSSAWGWKLFAGLLGMIAGIAVVRHPLWSSVLLPATVAFILGIQGIIVGVISLIFAFKGGGWSSGIVGILSIVFGIVLMLNPFLSGLSLIFFIGGLAVIGGILAIFTAFQTRKLQI